jgi:sec-independent protein translocase protein TatA
MFSSVLLFLNIGGPEMILIVFVALLLFGGEKLPEIARGLGKGIRDFKDASEGVKREITNQINSYEDRKTEEPTVTPPVAELPAADEHVTAEHTEDITHEHVESTPEHETNSVPTVPNTMPFVEHYGHVPDNHIAEEHTTENKTEPVKTTHE